MVALEPRIALVDARALGGLGDIEPGRGAILAYDRHRFRHVLLDFSRGLLQGGIENGSRAGHDSPERFGLPCRLEEPVASIEQGAGRREDLIDGHVRVARMRVQDGERGFGAIGQVGEEDVE